MIARRVSHGLGVDTSPDALSLAIAAFLVSGLVLWILGGRRREDAWIGYLAVPQAIVVALFQNPDRTRHAYPLVLALVVLALLGWTRFSRPIGRVGWLLGFLVVGRGLLVLHERATTLPPALVCAREVTRRSRDGETWVFCGESSRFFDLEPAAEKLLVVRARDLDGVRQEVNMRPFTPENVVVFSEVPGQDPAAAIFTARESPLVYESDAAGLYLYQAVRDPAQRYVSLRPVLRSGHSDSAEGPVR
jgi:hypothetical protein